MTGSGPKTSDLRERRFFSGLSATIEKSTSRQPPVSRGCIFLSLSSASRIAPSKWICTAMSLAISCPLLQIAKYIQLLRFRRHPDFRIFQLDIQNRCSLLQIDLSFQYQSDMLQSAFPDIGERLVESGCDGFGEPSDFPDLVRQGRAPGFEPVDGFYFPESFRYGSQPVEQFPDMVEISWL